MERTTLSTWLDAEQGRNRLSRVYRWAAWCFLAAGVFVWTPFVVAAVGFLWGGYLFRREGL